MSNGRPWAIVSSQAPGSYGAGRIGAIPLDRSGHAETTWDRSVSISGQTTWTAGNLLLGRFDGYRVSGYRVHDGREVLEPFVEPSGAWWAGEQLLASELVQGVVLRMRRVHAYRPTAPDDPLWTATLVMSSDLSTVEPVPSANAVLLGSNEAYVLLDETTGETRWTAEITNDGQLSCTVEGTDGSALFYLCSDFSGRRLVAIAHTPAQSS